MRAERLCAYKSLMNAERLYTRARRHALLNIYIPVMRNCLYIGIHGCWRTVYIVYAGRVYTCDDHIFFSSGYSVEGLFIVVYYTVVFALFAHYSI